MSSFEGCLFNFSLHFLLEFFGFNVVEFFDSIKYMCLYVYITYQKIYTYLNSLDIIPLSYICYTNTFAHFSLFFFYDSLPISSLWRRFFSAIYLLVCFSIINSLITGDSLEANIMDEFVYVYFHLFYDVRYNSGEFFPKCNCSFKRFLEVKKASWVGIRMMMG